MLALTLCIVTMVLMLSACKNDQANNAINSPNIKTGEAFVDETINEDGVGAILEEDISINEDPSYTEHAMELETKREELYENKETLESSRITLAIDKSLSDKIETFEFNRLSNEGYLSYTIYDKASKEAGYGGDVFTVMMYTDTQFDVSVLPNYYCIGTMSTPDYGLLEVIVTLPTDVQFGEETMESYMSIQNSIDEIVETLQPVNASDFYN